MTLTVVDIGFVLENVSETSFGCDWLFGEIATISRSY